MTHSSNNGAVHRSLQALDQGFQRVVMDIPGAAEAARLLDLTVGSVALLPGQLLIHQRIQLALAEREKAMEVVRMYVTSDPYERWQYEQMIENRTKKIIRYLTQ